MFLLFSLLLFFSSSPWFYQKKNHEKKPHKHPTTLILDPYDDSIEELNNLIGELDSFQREHELKSKFLMKNQTSTTSVDVDCCDISENLSLYGGSAVGGYCGRNDSVTTIPNSSSTDSMMLNDEFLNYESNRLYDGGVGGSGNNGFENPSFIHINHQENVGFDSNYVRENTEIVVLRYNRENSCDTSVETETQQSSRTSKIPQSRLKGESIGGTGGGSHLQRFSSFRSSTNYNYTISPLSTANNSLTNGRGGNNVSGNYTSGGYSNGNNNDDDDEYNYDDRTNLKEIENIMINIENHEQSAQDERTRAKPVISPRPASLSGLFYFFSN